MYELKSRLDSLKERFDSFLQTLKIGDRKKRIAELQEESSKPNLWDDQDHARSVMQEFGDLTHEMEEIEQFESELNILLELSNEDLEGFVSELETLEKRLDKLETKAYLSGEFDRKAAILSIHAGQGGTEAMDWTSMLFRMYTRFAERREWRVDILETTYGEEAGIKSVTMKIAGTYAYGYLKGEAGTHRLVRQSPFNADNLRQTSFALVDVMPELEDVDLSSIDIKDEDLEIQFYRAGGHGGQNVNKVSTAVRLRHIPSNIVVTAQTERFQEQNRKIAMNLLRTRIFLMEQERAKEAKKEIRGEYRPASWGTQIRSYVLHPYKMIKDLRTDVETGNTDAVLDGELDEFIEAELKLFAIK
jgi:peptide chain release factor 2